MPKTFKEYLGGVRLGNYDNIEPMADLGDLPPKGMAGKDSRGVGLHATYSSQAAGTVKPMLTADAKKLQQKNWKEKGHGPYRKEEVEENKEYDLKDKALYYKLVRQAMSVMPGSQKQKQIKKEIERVQKRLGIKEDTKRIPRKKGQPAGSDKHSDLYTDENPKGTIHGLGFVDKETAIKSVNKIKNSGKTHAHKIQAAIAMSQRAKVASERAKNTETKSRLRDAHLVYQKYIDSIKKKD